MKNLSDRLQEFLDSKEDIEKTKKYFINLDNKESMFCIRADKLNTYLTSLTKNQIEEFFNKLIDKNKEFISRMEYPRNNELSNLIVFLFRVAETYGKNAKEITNFPSNSTLYFYHTFIIMYGQGCLFRIKRKEEIIFNL